MPVQKPLSPKQKMLADGILMGMTLARAHEAAGYKGSNDASRSVTAAGTLKIPSIVLYMEQQKAKSAEKAANKLALTKEWVLAQLRENVELGKEVGPDGKPFGLPASNQALNLIGKELAMFIDRAEVVHADLSKMDVGDLMSAREIEQARLARLMARYNIHAALAPGGNGSEQKPN